MFERLAPLQVFFAGLLALGAAVATATWLAAQQPWLGLSLEPAGADGLRVSAVSARGPASGLLEPGDVIQVAGREGELVSLAHYNPVVAPHVYPTYAEYEAYLAFQQPLAEAVGDGALTLRLQNGRTVELQPAPRHPWFALGLDFWLLNLFGLMAAMIGLAVWVFRPGLDSARLLAVSGLGFFIATWNHSIWTVRDIALSAELFDLILRGNSLALHVMLGALMALLASYPRRIASGWVRVGMVFTAVALIQLNENLHLFDWPQHSFYSPILLYYLVGAALAFIQWRNSGSDPLDRGALRWVVLSVLMSTGAGLAAYFVPLFFLGEAFVSTPVMVGLAVTLYVGFALGVLRYRLFDLERWWFDAWIWFFGGVAVIAADAALVLLLGWEPVYALGLAVIVTGWGYFPARQWLWRWLVGGPQAGTAQDLAELVQRVFAAGSDESVEQTWRETLVARLEPLSVDAAPEGWRVEHAALAENGARLDVPGIAGGPGFMLRFGQHGRRLFSRRDEVFVATMHRVGARIHGVRRAQEEAARQERKRIMRDLHDDVGGQLLSLILTAEDEKREHMARRALQRLREAVNALDDDQRRGLEDFLDDWRDGAEERLAPGGTELLVEGEWEGVAGRDLSPRQAINLRRVLDEALTNALKHAQPRWLRLRLRHDGELLHMAVEHDGLSRQMDNNEGADGGRGLLNMKTRLQELGGTIDAGAREQSNGRVFCVAFAVPLD